MTPSYVQKKPRFVNQEIIITEESEFDVESHQKKKMFVLPEIMSIEKFNFDESENKKKSNFVNTETNTDANQFDELSNELSMEDLNEKRLKKPKQTKIA